MKTDLLKRAGLFSGVTPAVTEGLAAAGPDLEKRIAAGVSSALADVPSKIQQGLERGIDLSKAQEALKAGLGDQWQQIAEEVGHQKEVLSNKLRNIGIYGGLGALGAAHAVSQIPAYALGRMTVPKYPDRGLQEERDASILKSLLIPGYYGYKRGVGQSARDVLSNQKLKNLIDAQEKEAFVKSARSRWFVPVANLYAYHKRRQRRKR